MPLLVTGSIGIDTVKTPYGESENCLGGSAVYFSMAASFFSPVRLVGAVGGDCPFDLASVFAGRNVDLKGLETRPHSRTFRWKGSYHDRMSEAMTENVELNVLAEAPPKVPGEFRNSRFVFLANTAPALQIELLAQVESPYFVAADTMNCWIDARLDDLKVLLRKINALIVNEDEARMLSHESSLIRAADRILEMGPGVVIVKRGESGSIMCNSDGGIFALAGYPTREVRDPTGAGDSFAGALMGYLAEKGSVDDAALRTAIAYGSVAASFTIEDFSLNRLTSITRADIDKRFEHLRNIVRF